MNKVTIKEIADRAGLSKPTVSRILNNRDFVVTKENREKVFKIARELDYRPNYFAKSLAAGKTKCIGFMGSLSLPNFRVPYFSNLLHSIESSMVETKSEYSLLIFGANYHETQDRTLELIQKGLVDGLILAVLSVDRIRFEETLLPELNKFGIPLVVIHSLSKELGYNNVGVNSFGTGYKAAEQLVKAGHKDIGFYQAEEKSPQMQEIFSGFKKALDDKGITLPDKNIIYPDYSHPDRVTYPPAYTTFKGMNKYPAALAIPSTEATYAAFRAFDEQGVRVPQDVAVVSLSNEVVNPYFERMLTRVCHPVREKAKVALNMLLDILDGKKARDQVHRQIVEPYSEIRESCGSKN